MSTPEILPGNPTEAGPDTRGNEPPPAWDDWMMYAEEDLCFARRRYRASGTKEDRRKLIEAIERAETFLISAKAAINAR
jgi:hypothetical protein